jgi:hypothetical protein
MQILPGLWAIFGESVCQGVSAIHAPHDDWKKLTASTLCMETTSKAPPALKPPTAVGDEKRSINLPL